MKKFNIIYILFCIFSIITLVSCSCSKEEEYTPNLQVCKQSYYCYLDTTSSVTVQYDQNKVTKEEMMSKLDYVAKILLEVEKIFSPEQTLQMQLNRVSTSELMYLNEKGGLDENGNPKYISVSKEFIDVLKKSNEISELLSGYFDVTVGPLTSLWDISNQSQYNTEHPELIKIPTTEEIIKAVSLIDYNSVLIDEVNNKVAFNKNGMKLDFGAIAKGYACDKVYEYMKSIENITICMIDLGGNIYSFGSSEGTTTEMAIRNPFYEYGVTGSTYTILSSPINDCSMVTSGIYERYIIKDGVTYHHLLNPETGYPFDNNIECVTIIGLSSMTCDALATGIYGLGLDEGIRIIQSLEDYNAVFVTKDKKVYIVGDIPYTPTEGLVGFEFIDVR